MNPSIPEPSVAVKWFDESSRAGNEAEISPEISREFDR
jgi:hypothetical protein